MGVVPCSTVWSSVGEMRGTRSRLACVVVRDLRSPFQLSSFRQRQDAFSTLSLLPFTSTTANMVDNTSLIYNEPPHGVPVPGTTLKKVVDESFNPDTVQLDSGFLLKLKAASLDPYLRGSSTQLSPAFPSLPLRFSRPSTKQEAGRLSTLGTPSRGATEMAGCTEQN